MSTPWLLCTFVIYKHTRKLILFHGLMLLNKNAKNCSIRLTIGNQYKCEFSMQCKNSLKLEWQWSYGRKCVPPNVSFWSLYFVVRMADFLKKHSSLMAPKLWLHVQTQQIHCEKQVSTRSVSEIGYRIQWKLYCNIEKAEVSYSQWKLYLYSSIIGVLGTENRTLKSPCSQ